jgi:hypothetical protein
MSPLRKDYRSEAFGDWLDSAGQPVEHAINCMSFLRQTKEGVLLTVRAFHAPLRTTRGLYV